MKIVQKILEKRLTTIVSIHEMQLDLMPGKGTIDAILRSNKTLLTAVAGQNRNVELNEIYANNRSRW